MSLDRHPSVLLGIQKSVCALLCCKTCVVHPFFCVGARRWGKQFQGLKPCPTTELFCVHERINKSSQNLEIMVKIPGEENRIKPCHASRCHSFSPELPRPSRLETQVHMILTRMLSDILKPFCRQSAACSLRSLGLTASKSRSPKAGHPKAGRSDFRNQRFETDTEKTRKMRKVPLTPEKQLSEEIPKSKNAENAENAENADTKTRKMRMTGFNVTGFR